MLFTFNLRERRRGRMGVLNRWVHIVANCTRQFAQACKLWNHIHGFRNSMVGQRREDQKTEEIIGNLWLKASFADYISSALGKFVQACKLLKRYCWYEECYRRKKAWESGYIESTGRDDCFESEKESWEQQVPLIHVNWFYSTRGGGLLCLACTSICLFARGSSTRYGFCAGLLTDFFACLALPTATAVHQCQQNNRGRNGLPIL